MQRTTGFGSFGHLSIIKRPHKILGDKKCVSIGSDVFIAERSFISLVTYDNGKQYTPELIIGDNVRIGSDLHISCMSRIVIENNVLMSGRIFIGDSIHDYHDITKPIINQPMITTGNVRVKEGAFIGINVCILPGVTIGRNSVIGAGAVVTSSVPDYAIAGGVPARILSQYDKRENKWKKSS